METMGEVREKGKRCFIQFRCICFTFVFMLSLEVKADTQRCMSSTNGFQVQNQI